VSNKPATSRLWKDGATTTAADGGTFNLLNGTVFTGNCSSQSTAVLSLSGNNSANIVGSALIGGANNSPGIQNSGTGILNVVGTVTGGPSNGGVGCRNVGTGITNITGIVSGSVSGGGGTGADNPNVGTLNVVGNVVGGNFAGFSYGINNSSTGTAIIVGNVTATSATNAFVSSNAYAINKISGNIINHSNGTAAIYATRYVVDRVPTNSVIQYSNVNMFTTDSLSAFSMPPVSAVRFGTSFANGTLTGTCKVPSQNSVNVGVPVDNTVGTAFLTPAALFDTSVASLTASNTLGARLKNSATVQSVGSVISSFSN
jgi:hypothetical protein